GSSTQGSRCVTRTRSPAGWGITMTRSDSSKGSPTDWDSGGRACRWISAASRRRRTPDSRMCPRSPWATASDARVNVRRQGTPLVLLLLLHPAACALRARAADVHSLTVRPVAPPAMLQEERRRGMAPRADAMSPAEQAVLRARLERQRAFHSLEAALHEKALRVGASSAASRRPGWRPAPA